MLIPINNQILFHFTEQIKYPSFPTQRLQICLKTYQNKILKKFIEQVATKQTEFPEHLNFQALFSKVPKNVLRLVGKRKDTGLLYR